MKNFKYLVLLFLLMGCGTIKKNLQKKQVELAQNTEKIEQYKKTIDSLSQKLTQVRSEKQKEVTKIEWRYTAPKIDTLFIKDKSPVWLRIGKDSVNISALPSGSTLSAGNTNERTVEFYERIINELKRKIETAEGKTITKTEIEYVDKEKFVEVERTAYNWWLFVLIFCLGLFTPELIKFSINKLKPGI